MVLVLLVAASCVPFVFLPMVLVLLVLLGGRCLRSVRIPACGAGAVGAAVAVDGCIGVILAGVGRTGLGPGAGVGRTGLGAGVAVRIGLTMT
eukprot:364270-Chlamydomonas_euryale.AAC.12